MASRKPLVIISGTQQEVASTDTLIPASIGDSAGTITYNNAGTSTFDPTNNRAGVLTCTGASTTLQIDTTVVRQTVIVTIVIGSGGTGCVITAGSNISLTGGITTLLYDSTAGATTDLVFRWSTALSKYKLVASTAQTVVDVITSSASDPTTSDILSGQVKDWKNTTSGAIKRWVNDSGVMKSITYS